MPRCLDSFDQSCYLCIHCLSLFVCLYLSVYLCITLSFALVSPILVSTSLSIFFPFSASLWSRPLSQPMYLCAIPFIYLYIYLSIHLSIPVHVCVSICVSAVFTCLSLYFLDYYISFSPSSLCLSLSLSVYLSFPMS